MHSLESRKESVELPLSDGVWTLDGDNLLRNGIVVEHIYNLNQTEDDRLWRIFCTLVAEEVANHE